jgi:hypothetical protein
MAVLHEMAGFLRTPHPPTNAVVHNRKATLV